MVEHIIKQTAQKVKENQNLKNTDYLDAEGLRSERGRTQTGFCN